MKWAEAFDFSIYRTNLIVWSVRCIVQTGRLVILWIHRLEYITGDWNNAVTHEAARRFRIKHKFQNKYSGIYLRFRGKFRE